MRDTGRGEGERRSSENAIKGEEESHEGEDRMGTEGMTGTTIATTAEAGKLLEAKQEETLKERNWRLLLKERELLSQKKAKTSKQDRRKRKYVRLSDAPPGTEEKAARPSDFPLGTEERTTVAIENSDDDNGTVRVENAPRQRESGRVDRQWEFYLISKMKDKSLTRTEKSVNATARRTGWHPTRTSRSNLSSKHKKWFDIQWNYDDASE